MSNIFISKKRWKTLEKKVTGLEKQFQSQTSGKGLSLTEQIEKSDFATMVDRICRLHPECKNYHETRVVTCNEFLRATRKMQGTDLEPYLAEIRTIPREGCFNIAFKIPLVSYEQLRSYR